MSNKLAGKQKPKKKKTNAGLIVVAAAVAVTVLAAIFLLRNAGAGGRLPGQTEVDLSQVTGPTATITVKDYGKIELQLDEKAAPLTVENFTALAKDGFYDGLTFHRIIDGFMIQGGDPLGNGTGGSEKTIPGEFAQNGIDNPISHKRGVISMARSQDMDSASSQFFIVQSNSTQLDGNYAGFGYVTSGMEIVDQICKDTPVQDGNGTVAPEDQPVIESITIH